SHRPPPPFPTRRSSDLTLRQEVGRATHARGHHRTGGGQGLDESDRRPFIARRVHHDVQVSIDRGQVSTPAVEEHGSLQTKPLARSEEHTSELQSRSDLV